MTATGQTGQDPTSTFQIDRALETLQERSQAWAKTPLAVRIEHLRTLLRRTAEVGPDLVAAAVAAKGGGRRFEGEDWIGAFAIQGRSLRAMIGTLENIERTGRVPIDASDVSVRDDGRVVVQVTPMDGWDRLLFPGWRGEVWLESEVEIDDLDANLGSFYTKSGQAEPGVAVVLGAGNVASIAPLDALHMLFVEGKTTIAVNVGGCLIPFGFSLYLLTSTAVGLFHALLGISLVSTISYISSRPIQGLGIGMPIFIAPISAAMAALLIDPAHSAPLAYIAGTLGVIIGADLLHPCRALGAKIWRARGRTLLRTGRHHRLHLCHAGGYGSGIGQRLGRLFR